MPQHLAMTKLQHDTLVQRLRGLQAEIRASLWDHMKTQAVEHLARTVRDDDGDTIFGIDAEVEDRLLERCQRWGQEQHFTLVGAHFPDLPEAKN